MIMFVRTFSIRNMYGVRLCLVVATLQTLLLAANCINLRRRSMPTQATFPVSKSGWRPVIGSGGYLYSFNTAPLHQSNYKIPVPVLDPSLSYTSTRPVPTRETTKLSPVAQSYKTTTLRTLPSPSPVPNQPINSYLNPFSLPNSGIAHFKYIGNYPVEVLRNPYNSFLRPVYSKYPAKYKQSLHNQQQYQQLTNVQPIQFGQYQLPRPIDIFGKPVENFKKPVENFGKQVENFGKQDAKKQQNTVLEIYKPEVYKLPTTDTAQQAVTQQVKTAQQQQQSLLGNVIPAFNAYPHFSFQDALHPPSILGTFGSFGVQSVKGREPAHPTTKTTYLPPQPTKQTIFNSFNYNPTYKSTPTQFTTTTPRYSSTANLNHLAFGSTFSDHKLTPTPYSKTNFPFKIDPNAGAKNGFKPSPQDPFIKHYQNDYNKITTYNPVSQTTTLASTFFDYNFPQNTQAQKYFNQNSNNKYENKKVNDNVAAGVNEQTKQYTSAPQNSGLDGTLNTPYRVTYEVTESTDSDHISHSSQDLWTPPSQIYDFSDHRTTPEPTKKQEYVEPILSKPSTTPLPELEEEFTIVTEGERGYEDSLNYDNNVESQSRRPLGDDFEPIGKHKLKDYYYKVSTPAYDTYNTRRTKKPSEATRVTIFETTTEAIRQTNDVPIEALPTLPPNQHFKRPNNPDAVDKDKIRKRNKNRRRRPGQGNPNRNRGETTTRAATTQVTRESFRTDPIQTTEEVYTIRPRPRTTKTTYETNPTSPSVTTDLTTSAVPTVTPTKPTIVKKLAARRPLTTTTDRTETTTLYKENETSKDSSIMKISSRPQPPKTAVTVYEFRTSQAPDYTHKQDEKDTPTSDVAVSITDTFKNTVETAQGFSFHKDVKPIEAVTYHPDRETTTEFFRQSDFGTETTTLRPETTSNTERSLRPRLRNKYNRPKFSVTDYRSRMSSTTSTTEKPADNVPRIRFPQRRLPFIENGNDETTTERKRFTPKDPRHRVNGTELNEESEKEIHSIRQPTRQRYPVENDGTTFKISSRIRQSPRRRPTEETSENPSTTTIHNKRPLRRKVVKDSETGESVQEFSVTEIVSEKNDISSERSHSESAIMKIADKKHQQDHVEHLFEHSKRVSDLTLASSKDYNNPGMFKTVASNSRRIPNYFTIATDDPILPIEAFFPQLNQKKES